MQRVNNSIIHYSHWNYHLNFLGAKITWNTRSTWTYRTFALCSLLKRGVFTKNCQHVYKLYITCTRLAQETRSSSRDEEALYAILIGPPFDGWNDVKRSVAGQQTGVWRQWWSVTCLIIATRSLISRRSCLIATAELALYKQVAASSMQHWEPR